ncbi:preprotein translocase subunit SecG [Candidatus Nomurabacteria bacterium]|nr:preprotein translocase subunit SecG [Candidatus Nomurabacteria bacterium]
MLFFANILPWLQVALAVLLVVAILLQQSSEGLGSAFGGGNSGGVFHAKRGFEKTLFLGTIILAGLFIIANILNLFL